MISTFFIEKSVTRLRSSLPNILLCADKMKKEGVLTDVTIKSGTEVIFAHRLVLCCCSQYFKDMLTSKHKENPSCIEIYGVKDKTVKTLIDYIYTGKIEINTENVMELLVGSNMFQLNDATQFCYDFIVSVFSIDNCIGILKEAKLNQNEILENEILKYIMKNWDEIIKASTFLSLSKKDLINFISALNRSQIDEPSLFWAITAWAKHYEKHEQDFPELMSLIHLEELSLDFLEDVVSVEELVSKNQQCYKLVMTTLVKLLKQRKRFLSTAFLNDQYRLLNVGGAGCWRNVVEIYALREEDKLDIPVLPAARSYHCSVKWNDFIYCIGGRSAMEIDDKVWRIHLNKKPLAWESIAPMNEKRHLMGTAVFQNKIVVAGGATSCFISKTELASVECLDPEMNQWNGLPDLKQPRCSNALVSCNSCLYALGGSCNDHALSSVERLRDLQDEKWENIEPLQNPRCHLAAVCCNDAIYAIGGESGVHKNDRFSSVEKYDTGFKKWIYVKEMNYARSYAAACVLDDKIFVVGGLDKSNHPVQVIECYDPSKDEWNVTQDMGRRLTGHSLIAV